MTDKTINFRVTENEFEQFKQKKGRRSWRQFFKEELDVSDPDLSVGDVELRTLPAEESETSPPSTTGNWATAIPFYAVVLLEWAKSLTLSPPGRAFLELPALTVPEKGRVSGTVITQSYDTFSGKNTPAAKEVIRQR